MNACCVCLARNARACRCAGVSLREVFLVVPFFFLAEAFFVEVFLEEEAALFLVEGRAGADESRANAIAGASNRRMNRLRSLTTNPEPATLLS